MTKHFLAAAAVAALTLVGCRNKNATWTAHDAGVLTIEFPCVPKATGGENMKCTRSDGTEYALRVVQKGLDPQAELAEALDYVREIPKGEVFQDKQFPLRWREVRQFGVLDFLMFYLDGKEYTLSVQYFSPPPPKEMDDFFAKAKAK
jgi:uncharacterized lipoprotein NlpE involved in copper resistance